MDLRSQVVILDSQAHILTRQEYRLSAMLVQHGDEVVPWTILLKQIFGCAPQAHTRTLDTHIRDGSLCPSAARIKFAIGLDC